jgi:hypothetical protein
VVFVSTAGVSIKRVWYVDGGVCWYWWCVFRGVRDLNGGVCCFFLCVYRESVRCDCCCMLVQLVFV